MHADRYDDVETGSGSDRRPILPPSISLPPFDPTDAKWYCACHTHCRVGSSIYFQLIFPFWQDGALAIGWLGIVLNMFGLVQTVAMIVSVAVGSDDGDRALYGLPNILTTLLGVLIGACTVRAVKTERPTLLLPAMVVLVGNMFSVHLSHRAS